MGLTRTDQYTAEIIRNAEFFKALGHPARLKIVHFLLSQKQCVCNVMVDELDLAQATVSQHLKVLKEVGIIQGTIEGTSVCYCINRETWNTIISTFSELSQLNSDTTDSCCK
jgi:DNA-binding transcriptional ArsR family regulator